MSEGNPGSEYVSHLASARLSSQINLGQEQAKHASGEKLWNWYNDGVRAYDKKFNKIVPEGFAKYVGKMGEKPLVLDAFAPSSFLRDLAQKRGGIQGGVALTLADLRNEREKKLDEKFNVVQLENANLYDRSPWIGKLQEYLKAQGKKGFDIITCAPVGGWDLVSKEGVTLFPPNDLVWLVTNFLWSQLNDNGELFMRMSYSSRASFDGWIEKMKTTGIVTKADELQVRFKKTPSVRNIPTFPTNSFIK